MVRRNGLGLVYIGVASVCIGVALASHELASVCIWGLAFACIGVALVGIVFVLSVCSFFLSGFLLPSRSVPRFAHKIHSLDNMPMRDAAKTCPKACLEVCPKARPRDMPPRI